MANAFGAFVRIDLIDQRPHEDRIVGALRLAYVAVDAVVGDDQGHGIRSDVSGRDLFLQPLLDGREDKFRYIATEYGDLAHDGAGDELVLI